MEAQQRPVKAGVHCELPVSFSGESVLHAVAAQAEGLVSRVCSDPTEP